jgi:hypothetical protein
MTRIPEGVGWTPGQVTTIKTTRRSHPRSAIPVTRHSVCGRQSCRPITGDGRRGYGWPFSAAPGCTPDVSRAKAIEAPLLSLTELTVQEAEM